jgi:hypothetical protein
MSADAPETSQAGAPNADELSRLLEIELIQKRAEWQKATARHKTVRTASILFLMVIVIAGLAAFYFAFMRATEGRQQHAAPISSESQR